MEQSQISIRPNQEYTPSPPLSLSSSSKGDLCSSSLPPPSSLYSSRYLSLFSSSGGGGGAARGWCLAVGAGNSAKTASKRTAPFCRPPLSLPFSALSLSLSPLLSSPFLLPYVLLLLLSSISPCFSSSSSSSAASSSSFAASSSSSSSSAASSRSASSSSSFLCLVVRACSFPLGVSLVPCSSTDNLTHRRHVPSIRLLAPSFFRLPSPFSASSWSAIRSTTLSPFFQRVRGCAELANATRPGRDNKCPERGSRDSSSSHRNHRVAASCLLVIVRRPIRVRRWSRSRQWFSTKSPAAQRRLLGRRLPVESEHELQRRMLVVRGTGFTGNHDPSATTVHVARKQVSRHRYLDSNRGLTDSLWYFHDHAARRPCA